MDAVGVLSGRDTAAGSFAAPCSRLSRSAAALASCSGCISLRKLLPIIDIGRVSRESWWRRSPFEQQPAQRPFGLSRAACVRHTSGSGSGKRRQSSQQPSSALCCGRLFAGAARPRSASSACFRRCTRHPSKAAHTPAPSCTAAAADQRPLACCPLACHFVAGPLSPGDPAAQPCRFGKLESSGGSTPEASTPASLQTTPSGIRSPADEGDGAAARRSPSPLRHTLQLAADRLAALRSGGDEATPSGSGASQYSRGVQRPGAAPAAAASPPPPTSVDHLLALSDQAQLVQAEADVLRDGLRGARRQLGALQQALLAMQRQAVRQQQVLGAALMELQCEAKLARSEAEAYRTAARARTAAVGTLQQ